MNLQLKIYYGAAMVLVATAFIIVLSKMIIRDIERGQKISQAKQAFPRIQFNPQNAHNEEWWGVTEIVRSGDGSVTFVNDHKQKVIIQGGAVIITFEKN